MYLEGCQALRALVLEFINNLTATDVVALDFSLLKRL